MTKSPVSVSASTGSVSTGSVSASPGGAFCGGLLRAAISPLAAMLRGRDRRRGRLQLATTAAAAATRRNRSMAAAAGDALEPRVLLDGHDGGHDDHDESHAHVFDAVDMSRPGVEAQVSAWEASRNDSPVGAGLTEAEVFNLSSRPDANKTIYLDFDGQTTNDMWWDPNPINTPAYDFDGDVSSFSQAEIDAIEEVYLRVAEDFSPFDVNVTTAEPPLGDLINAGGGDQRWGIRVVIGGDGSWFAPAGGVAFLNSFNADVDRHTFVFSDNTGRGFPKFVADAASHEVGHTLGLRHDGEEGGDGEYYDGHGPDSGDNRNTWGPIMGSGYYATLGQFSKGEYNNATNLEDDLSIITTRNGFGYRADDFGLVGSSAGELPIVVDGNNNTTFVQDGVIERNTDIDAFRLEIGSGRIDVRLDVAEIGANLNASLQLLNDQGQVLMTSSPDVQLGASLQADVDAGLYYLAVDGVGEAATGDDDDGQGYSDYGSIGQYTLSGSLPPRLLFDPNDAIDEATELTLGTAAADRIVLDTDVDMYSVTLTETGILRLDVDTFASTLDSALRLFDGAGNEIAINLDGTEAGPGLEDDPEDPYIRMQLDAGTYFVGISQNENVEYDAVTGENDVEGETLGIYELTASIDPAPIVQYGGGTVRYTEGELPTRLLRGPVSIVDSDNSGDFDGTSVLARIVRSRQVGERFTLNSGRGVTIGEGRVSVDGTAVATVQTMGSQLAFTFDGPTTASQASRVLEAIHYRIANDQPSASKLAQIWVTDAAGNRSVLNQRIEITSVNSGPVLGNIRLQTSVFENGGPAKISGQAHIADGDLNGGVVEVAFTGLQASDRVGMDFSGPLSTTGSTSVAAQTGDEIFMNGRKLADVVVQTEGATRSWQFVLTEGTDRFAARELIRAFQLSVLGENPGRGARSATITVTDDFGASDSATINLVVRANEDPARLTVGTSQFTALGRTQRLNSNPRLVDPDSSDFAGGRIVVDFAGTGRPGDRLRLLNSSGRVLAVGEEIRLGGGPIGTVTESGMQLRVQFNSRASLRDVEMVLSRVRYDSVGTIDPGTRTVRLAAIDRGSNYTAADLTVTRPDSAPVVDEAVADLLASDWL